MDIKDYRVGKAKGVIVPMKKDGKVGVSVATFNQTTGEQNPAEWQELNIYQLRGLVVEYRDLANRIEELVADLEALE